MDNIWLIGTGKFAALCLEALTKRNITFSRIITGLPTRSGRSGKENPSAVEITASSLGLSVIRTGKLTENETLITALTETPPDVIFVIDFGQIIREPFLSRLCLNIHPSLLPEYRGAAPIQRALLDGKNYTGVTVFRLAKAMDAGDILAQKRIDISANDSASTLYESLAEIGSSLAAEALSSREGLAFTPQDDSRATYAPKLDKKDFELTFSMTAEKFSDTVKALDMSGGAYIMIRGKRVKIWRASVRNDLKSDTPGQVLECAENLVVSCSDCGVELAEVQSEGKNKISGQQWARGIRLKCEDIL